MMRLISLVLSLILFTTTQGCIFLPQNCIPSCDWTNVAIWMNCTSGFPSLSTDVAFITAEGNYQISYSSSKDINLKGFHLGSSSGTGSQVVKIQLIGSIFSISTPSFEISSSGVLSIEGQSGVKLSQNPPIIASGGRFYVGVQTSTMTIQYNSPMIVDGNFLIYSLSSSIPISQKVLISSSIMGSGHMHTLNNTLVGFSSGAEISTANLTTDGQIFGFLNFTGNNYLNNGIIGYETTGANLFTNVSVLRTAVLSNTSILNIFLNNETDHLIFNAGNIILGGALVVISGSNLVITSQTVIPLVTGDFSGNFSSETLAFSAFSNRADCSYTVIYEKTTNRVALNFEACDAILESGGVLGYDKKTMIYFGVGLGVAIILIIVVACVIRRWKDCREKIRGRRNFYNLKDDEFFKDFNDDKD